MTDYTKMIKTLRECANWFEAVAASSQYAHYELMDLDYGDKLRDAADALEAAEKRIAELMPKEGEWQWLSSTYDRVPCEMRYVCSVCHHQEITHYDKPWKHYCPNCGAKMKGENDGES